MEVFHITSAPNSGKLGMLNADDGESVNIKTKYYFYISEPKDFQKLINFIKNYIKQNNIKYFRFSQIDKRKC